MPRRVDDRLPEGDMNRAPIDESGQITVDRLAGLLCRDAQDEDYDHGPNPTIAYWLDPLPSCPRHYGMAYRMLHPEGPTT